MTPVEEKPVLPPKTPPRTPTAAAAEPLNDFDVNNVEVTSPVNTNNNDSFDLLAGQNNADDDSFDLLSGAPQVPTVVFIWHNKSK